MKFVTEDIFKVNNRPDIERNYIGSEENLLITIEDAFLDCDAVLKTLKRYPLSLRENYSTQLFKNSFPGMSSFIPMEAFPIKWVLIDMINSYYGESYDLNNTKIFMRFHVVDTQQQTDLKYLLPHTDTCKYAANIFLNDFPGGTAFYRSNIIEAEQYNRNHRHKKEYNILSGYYYNLFADEQKTKFNSIEKDENWDLYYIDPIKKNKLNLYPSNLFHTMYVKQGYSKLFNRYRYSLAFFID